MAGDVLVSLEIGTRVVRVVVGEFRHDGHLLVTGIGQVPSRGVRKAEIVSFDNAAACVNEALQAAEEQSRTLIRSVYLAISGAHIQCQENRGQTPIIPAGKEIDEEDINEALEAARAVSIPEDRVVIHTIRQKFVVDERSEVLDPRGISGRRLDACVLAIHAEKNRLTDLVRVAQACDVDVADVAFSGLCAALAVMTPEKKESGSLVVDLGAGTTDFLVYADRAIAAAGSIAVGGDHVTNDIAIGLGGLAYSTAEEIKVRYGSAGVTTDYDEVIPVPSTTGVAASAYRRDLQLIISARLSELFEILRNMLEEWGLLRRLAGGVVLTGGGARMEGVTELCRHIMGLPCRVGLPHEVSGLALAGEAPELATTVGLLKYAYRAQAEVRPGRGFLQRLAELLPIRR